MDKMYVYLIRHGDIGLGSEKSYIGQGDLPLSDIGKRQAGLLKSLFGEVTLDNIYCSDLTRSRQTAEIIASTHLIQPVVRAELREVDVGDWDGKSFAEIKARYPLEFKQRGEDIANHCPPGGESFADCSRRVLPLWEALTHTEARKIMIVGHAGVNRIILCHILGLSLAHLFRLEQGYGCVNLVVNEGKGSRLIFCNQTVGDILQFSEAKMEVTSGANRFSL